MRPVHLIPILTLAVTAIAVPAWTGGAAPLVPVRLLATGAGSGRINLSWIDPTPQVEGDETGFEVEARSRGQNFVHIGEAAGDTESFAHGPGLDAGVVYTYRVRAVRGAESSDWTPEVAARPGLRPLFLIPGLAGTVLDEDRTRNQTRRCSAPDLLSWEYPRAISRESYIPGGDPRALQFGPDGRPSTALSRSLRPVGMLNVCIPSQVDLPDLWDLVARLEAEGYRLNRTLFVFAYDWRLSITENARRLRRRISQETAPVDIVAHSMGALIAQEALRQPAVHGRVRTAVLMGPPHLGAPMAFQALRYGYDFDTPAVDPVKVKRAAHNLPGLYDLVPTAGYLAAAGYISDEADLDADGVTGPLTDPTALDRFLRNAVEKIRPLNRRKDPAPHDRLNGRQLDRAAGFRGAIEAWVRPPSSTRIYLLAGYGRLTPVGYREFRDGTDIRCERTLNDAGDGTVPVVSLDPLASQMDRSYWIDGAATGMGHGTFGSVPVVQDLILALVRGTPPRERLPDYTIDRNRVSTGSRTEYDLIP